MEDFTIHKLGIYPFSKYYIEELNMFEVFTRYLPKVKGSTILSESLCVLIQNIVVSPSPLYQIQDWLKSYADGQGEFGYEANSFTDDRLGTALDALYNSERQSIMTEITSKAIALHKLDTSVVHNDTTTISLQGKYENQEEEGIQLKRGYNKDYRPDCKQIVFGLNVTSDGYVPISMRLYDGNTSDDQTHIVNWNALRSELQQLDFCYIADSKVATKENMAHISGASGKFISLLPGSRTECKNFKDLLRCGEPDIVWRDEQIYPNSRDKNNSTRYKFFEDKKTEDGFRLIWVHSDTKEEVEKEKRTNKIKAIIVSLEEMQLKLNRYKLKTKSQIEQAVAKSMAGYSSFFNTEVIEHKELITKRVGRGRPGPNSKYEKITKLSYSLIFSLDAQAIEKEERQDGVFPLVTNTNWEVAKVLKTYKKQPYLEKRFSTLKSVLQGMPMFLKLPKRIEAMLLLYFFALMIVSLIERQIRKSMKEEKIEKLPILPQGMNTATPTINNLRYLFRDAMLLVVKSKITNDVQFLKKGLNKTHNLVLKLLEIPPETYEIKNMNWWKFQAALNH